MFRLKYFFQVENLFRIYYDKRHSRITKRRPSQRKKEVMMQVEDGKDSELDPTVSNSMRENRILSESDGG